MGRVLEVISILEIFPSQEELLSHAILLLSGGQHGTCS